MTRHAHLTLAGLMLLPTAAAAQVLVAWKIPVGTMVVGDSRPPGGHRYELCGGGRVEYEILFENASETDATAELDDRVQAGLNGNLLELTCPPTYLPPGVDPINDVTCDDVNHRLIVRNITVPACGRASVRFVASVLGSIVDICNGADIIEPFRRSRTKSLLADQVPRTQDTCFFVNPLCGGGGPTMRHFYSDENGHPALAGDTVLIESWLDLNVPFPEVEFGNFFENTNLFDELAALPAGLEFVEWVDKPLEAYGAVYVWDPVNRTVSIVPGSTPVKIPTGTDQLFVRWRGRIGCGTAPGTRLCTFSSFHFPRGGGAGSDDPSTTRHDSDAACIVAVQPAFTPSRKTVADADVSGDAQPGEWLTFSVRVENASPCPTWNDACDWDGCPNGLLGCECEATRVEVSDLVDVARLEDIRPLDGGTLVAPDRVEWLLPRAGSAGRFPNPQTVRFQARVRPGVADGELICNTATIAAAEITNVADGGVSNCATESYSATLSPCIRVRIPPTPYLTIDKSISPPVTPPATGYPPGTRLTYSVVVTNTGGLATSDVVVWDAIDTRWDPAQLVPLDAGVFCFGPPNCPSRRVTWPTIPVLAPGASQTFRFEVVVPKTLPDGTVLPNTASTTSREITTAIASNTVDAEVCAPSLVFAKSLVKPSYEECETIEWVITLRNDGSCAATNVVIEDPVDLTKLEGPPVLTWSPASGVLVGNRITWNVASLAPFGAQTLEFRVSSRPLVGTAGSRVCDTATVTWAEYWTSQSTTPQAGRCADIVACTGICPAVRSEVRTVWASKQPTRDDVHLEWPAVPDAEDGYNVWRVTDKVEIPNAKSPGNPPVAAVCTPSAAPSCDDPGAVPGTPGTIYFYQARGLCGADEGP